MNTIRIFKHTTSSSWAAFINIYFEDKAKPGHYSYVRFQRHDLNPMVALGRLFLAVKEMLGITDQVLMIYNPKGYDKMVTLVGMPSVGKGSLLRIDDLVPEAAIAMWILQFGELVHLDIIYPKEEDRLFMARHIVDTRSMYVYQMNIPPYAIKYKDRQEMEFLEKFGFQYNSLDRQKVLLNDPA